MKFFKFEDFYIAQDLVITAQATEIDEEVLVSIKDAQLSENLLVRYDFVTEQILNIEWKYNHETFVFENVNGCFEKNTLRGLTRKLSNINFSEIAI
jgi:hypothetical protein